MKRNSLVLLVLIGSMSELSAAKHGHLLPVGPFFDHLPPIDKTYARVCERMLFPASDWVLRYYSSTESVTTGLSIYKRSEGQFGLSIRQTKPELYSVISNAFYNRLSLESSLAAVKVEKADSQIPEEVATALQKYWVWLLSDLQPETKRKSPYIGSAIVILYAKAPDGNIVAGKFPADADKYYNLRSVESIVDDLIKSSDQSPSTRANILKEVGRKARERH